MSNNQRNPATLADYSIIALNDLHVLLVDDQTTGKPSLTNSAALVVADLHGKVEGGLGGRRVFYLDTINRFDELVHRGGEFIGFLSCAASQQAFLQSLADEHGLKR